MVLDVIPWQTRGEGGTDAEIVPLRHVWEGVMVVMRVQSWFTAHIIDAGFSIRVIDRYIICSFNRNLGGAGGR